MTQLERRELGDGNYIEHGMLPAGHLIEQRLFEELWDLHPEEQHLVRMYGRMVPTPRYQQSYLRNYEYSGSKNNALPCPPLLKPLLVWLQKELCQSLNGLLLNWYDGPDHYIGPHHDSTKSLVPGMPIVTVSFGEQRRFRLSRGKGSDKKNVDIPAPHGQIIVLPWETNLVWKHSVPKSAKYRGRRISVTCRSFQVNEPEPS